MATEPPNAPSTWRRLRWEVVVFSLLAAGIYGAWEFQAYRSRQVLALESERWTAAVARLEQKVAQQAGHQDERDGEVAFHAFAAGLAAVGLGEMTPSITALLHVEEVRFVHILHLDGTVIASSDRKLETLGRADEGESWSLGVTELVVRTIPGRGTEVAGPIVVGGEDAVLWLGWRTP
jgi:hypothetical protein